jgi:hypothetical protein
MNGCGSCLSTPFLEWSCLEGAPQFIGISIAVHQSFPFDLSIHRPSFRLLQRVHLGTWAIALEAARLFSPALRRLSTYRFAGTSDMLGFAVGFDKRDDCA